MKLSICVNNYYKLGLSFIITAFCIYIAFTGENYRELSSHIENINTQFVILCMGLMVFSCFIRALRWKYILFSKGVYNFHPLFSSVMIGYFGNNVLPFRVGEILRSYSISHSSNSSFTTIFGSVILERIMDLSFVIIMFFLILPWLPSESYYLKYSVAILALIIISFFLLIGLGKYYKIFSLIREMNIMKNRLGLKILNFAKIFLNTIMSIKNSHHGIEIFILSLILWAVYYLSTYILLLSFDLKLGFVSIWLLLIVGSLAIGIPALPGAAGTYDAGVKFTLISLINIASEKALAFALISHAVSYIPFTIIGAIYFFLGAISLKDIKKQDLVV